MRPVEESERDPRAAAWRAFVASGALDALIAKAVAEAQKRGGAR